MSGFIAILKISAEIQRFTEGDLQRVMLLKFEKMRLYVKKTHFASAFDFFSSYIIADVEVLSE